MSAETTTPRQPEADRAIRYVDAIMRLYISHGYTCTPRIVKALRHHASEIECGRPTIAASPEAIMNFYGTIIPCEM